MVSQPSHTLTLLPPPPPPPPPHTSRPRPAQSVVSERIERPSASRFLTDSGSFRREGRQHRATRSHTGSSSYQVDNKYPEFKVSGNVEIVINIRGTEKRWLLHQHMLKQYSGWFEGRTSVVWEDPSNQQLQIREDGHRRSSRSEGGNSGRSVPQPQRWRFELDQNSSSGHDSPMLVAVPPRPRNSPYDMDSPPQVAVKNKPHGISSGFFHSVANLAIGSQRPILPPAKPRLNKADEALIRDYDNLFRVFYNERLCLDRTSISTAFVQCDGLLELADAYDAVRCVRERINAHLMQFGAELYKDVAMHSAAYLRLGYLIRNEDIYKEALIHVVGRWPLDQTYLDGTILPDSVLDMIEAKAEILRRQALEIENKLLKLTLVNRHGQRVRHGMGMNSLAVELWKDWFQESLYVPPSKPPSSRTSRPSTGSDVKETERQRQHKTLRRIGLGPDSYLTPEDVKEELKKTKELYNRENLVRLRLKVNDMKALAQETVQPLMRQESRVTGHGYLICTRVTDTDYLWINED